MHFCYPTFNPENFLLFHSANAIISLYAAAGFRYCLANDDGLPTSLSAVIIITVAAAVHYKLECLGNASGAATAGWGSVVSCRVL